MQHLLNTDINVIKQFITQEHLKKLGLKWGYSTTKKHFIGFKVTVVLERTTLTPVSIFIHPGVPIMMQEFLKGF